MCIRDRLEADRLRPRPVGRLGVAVGELLGALVGKAGLERVMRRPPDFAGEPVAAFAQRVDDGGEQQRLADSDDLRLEALLRRLRPEGREVGWDHICLLYTSDAADDLTRVDLG